MLQDLLWRLGEPGLKRALAAPSDTLRDWLRGRREPSWVSLRAIWLLWCLVFHPELLTSFDSIARWGHLPGRPPPPEPGHEHERRT